jgi:hypothetical protein
MRTLIVESKKDQFFYVLMYPHITSFDEKTDEKCRLICEKRKEAKWNELVLYEWDNKIGVAGTGDTSLQGGAGYPNSINEFDVQDIQGLVLRNMRPAQGVGFVCLDIKLNSGEQKEMFLFFMKDNSSDVARWDKKVKLFEDEVLPGILSFMNTGLLQKIEGYNA